MMTSPFLLHALSPLHAGTGQAEDLVDLPIARTRGLSLPFVPGSSIKGVLRDAWTDTAEATRLFGPAPKDAAKDPDNARAGALVVGDARLLAMPVRSFRGTFAWVTSPLLLTLAQRDLGLSLKIPVVSNDASARVAEGSSVLYQGKAVFLEDIDLEAKEDAQVSPWADWLARKLYPDRPEVVRRRFVVVDDETMTFLAETATQVDTRVAIDDERGTVRDGALWLEESLPAESVLVGVLGLQLLKDEVMKDALKRVLGVGTLQLGGKSTVGRGRCRLLAGGA